MYLGEITKSSRHTRSSKLGKIHKYTRNYRLAKLRCDCCGTEFTRERSKMDPNRL